MAPGFRQMECLSPLRARSAQAQMGLRSLGNNNDMYRSGTYEMASWQAPGRLTEMMPGMKRISILQA